jgi:hypothetical protein
LWLRQMVLPWYVCFWCVLCGVWWVVWKKSQERKRVKWATNLTAGGAEGRAGNRRGSVFTSHCSCVARAMNNSLLIIVLSLTSNSDLIVSTATTTRSAYCLPINRIFDRSRISRRQARLFSTIRAMIIAFGRQKRSGVLDCTSLVRIRVYLADLLDATIFAESCLRAIRLISLDLSDNFIARLLDTTTNIRVSAGTDLRISMASVNVTETMLDRSSVQARQIPGRHARYLDGG